jgi:lysophospholipase L1-like esterase
MSGLTQRLTPQEPRRREMLAMMVLLLAASLTSVAAVTTGSGPGPSGDQAADIVEDPTPEVTFGELANWTFAPGFTVTPTPKPTAKPKPKPTKYNGKMYKFVAIGDSLTAWPIRYNWAHCLDVNDQKAVMVNNAGVAGNLTSQMRARFSRDVLAYKPDFVLIMGGTNDISDKHGVSQSDVIANLRAMVRDAKAKKVKPYLMLIPPQSYYGSVSTVKSLNAAIIRLANSEKIYYVDSYSSLATSGGVIKSAYSWDGLHLTYEGASRVGALAWQRVRRQGF